MKRLLIIFLCAVLTLSSLSFSAGAADSAIVDTAAPTDLASASADADIASSGATADEIAPTGWSLLTEAQFQSKLSSLRSKYPDGTIWEGYYYENGSIKASTCWAYAAQMLYEVFGARFYADSVMDYKYYNAYEVNAGDWVRIDWDSHSIFITKVTGDGIYYTDGNGTGVYNQVRWDGYYSWSTFYSRFAYGIKLPGNKLTGEEIDHTVAYSGNGGSGSMTSQIVKPSGGFTLQSSSFTRSGYSFAGYTCKRSYDNKWYTSDAGWQTQDEIYNNGYHYKFYPQGNSYTLGTPWIGGINVSTTFTFYAQWLPDQATLEFAANYSGYNYILGSDLGSGYSDYIYSRDPSAYTVSVDDTEKLNNASSVKITGSKAGSSASDLAIVTSTNKGYGNGYSQAGSVGDEKTYTLHFYAKASVDGAKMYFRWGFTTNYVTVELSKNWQTYTVNLPKNRFCGYALHPYFDKAGTFYLNSLALGDETFTSNVAPETGTWAAADRKVTRGEAPDSLPTPVREGYTFLGWYTAAEGGERITTQTPINESTLRVYAHWMKNISDTPVQTVSWGGHVYELYDNAVMWDAAKSLCAAKGGHLITIGSESENSIAYEMIRGRQGYCWIGLTCTQGTTDWKWVDGTAYTYKNWYNSSYGTKDSGEYYGLLYPSDFGTKNYASTWDKCKGSDYFCSYYGYYNSFYICEYDKSLLCGDADGDGTVTAVDATNVQRYLSSLNAHADEETLMNADIDKNGRLEIIDITYIQRHLAGMSIPYTIGY